MEQMDKTTPKKYWLNTYFPYYRWKQRCETREQAVVRLGNIIAMSVGFWENHPQLCIKYFGKTFSTDWWVPRYAHDDKFTGFSILELEITPRRERRWFKEMTMPIPPVPLVMQLDQEDLSDLTK